MKRATVRDLRYAFPTVEAALAEGEEIEIVKRNKVIAKLVPVAPETTPEMPDFMARLKRIYGDRVSEITGADIVAADRDRF